MREFLAKSNKKLSEFLLDKFNGELSYNALMKLFRNKDIKVNGKRVGKDVLLNENDKITVYYDGKKVDAKFRIIFQNADILACDKTDDITSEDLEKIVRNKYENARLVHRLDRNTRGIILFALNDLAENELLKAFKNRKIKKYYVCEVYGKPPKSEDVLTDFLVKDSKNSLVKIYKKQVVNSVKIITKYKVLKEYENSTLLEVELITGKTHQIRAHLSSIGNFIIGDGKYGNNKINKSFNQKTQKLCSYKIEFDFKSGYLQYLDGQVVEIENPFK